MIPNPALRFRPQTGPVPSDDLKQLQQQVGGEGQGAAEVELAACDPEISVPDAGATILQAGQKRRVSRRRPLFPFSDQGVDDARLAEVFPHPVFGRGAEAAAHAGQLLLPGIGQRILVPPAQIVEVGSNVEEELLGGGGLR